MITTPTLTGEHVVLEPLGPQHYAGLAAISTDTSLWKYMLDRIHGDDDVPRWATSPPVQGARPGPQSSSPG